MNNKASLKDKANAKFNEKLDKLKERDTGTWLWVYKLLVILQVFGQSLFVFFPTAFLLGGTHYEPYAESVAGTLFNIASIVVHFGFWAYVRYYNIGFLKGKYLSGEVEDLTEERKGIHIGQRVEQRKSALTTALVSLVVGTIYIAVSGWTWLNRNGQFIPNDVGDNVLNAPKPGAYVANTVHVGNVEFVRYDFNQVIPIFVRTVIIVYFIMLYVRLASDSTVLVGAGTMNEDRTQIKKHGVLSYSAYALFGILIGMGLTFTVNDSGTHDGISIIVLGGFYAGAVFAFIIYLVGFWLEKDGFSEDLYWRIVQSIFVAIALLSAYGIYFGYVWGTVRHSGPDWNNGWSPTFDFTAPPAGQSSYFLYTLDIGIIATASIIFCCVILGLIIFESNAEMRSIVFLSEIQRPSIAWTIACKWAFIAFSMVVSAFLLNELYGTVYLAKHWEGFTISTIIAAFVICAPLSILSFLDYVGSSNKVGRELNYPTISILIVSVVFLGLWTWILAWVSTHFNSLGHSAAVANIKDETKALYVYWYALLTKLLLLMYFAILFSVQYLAESVMALIVTGELLEEQERHSA